jgi:hypothetical protein
MLPRARRVSIPLSLSLLALFAAGTASAACQQPRMLSLSEKNGPNCDARTCGFIIAHWAGAPGCDHYNIRERSGTQFEAPGTNRGQLHNRRSAQFPGRFGSNNTIHVRVQGCTRNFFGNSSCGAWSNEVSHRIHDSTTSPKGVACRRYAERAVDALKLARDTYKCDPKVISGPRWTSDFEAHRSFCIGAPAAQSNAEDRARNATVAQCRANAGKPQGGKAKISVRSTGGDTFFITGSGFAPNAPVIIRISGPGASIATVTVANNQRITADARGNINIRLFGAQICKRGGGTVTFTAEDQDNPKSAPVSAKCAP